MIWHSNSIESVAQELNTNIQLGLSDEEAFARLDKINKKIQEKSNKKNIFNYILEETKKPFYTYLLIVSILTVLFNLVFNVLTIFEPIMLLLLVLIKIIIQSIATMVCEEGLNKTTLEESATIKCLRNGKIKNVPSNKIVPGDVIYLESGNYIPADARLIAENSLHCDEYVITGEAVAVPKDSKSMHDEIALVQDRSNMVFAGSHVVSGSGVAIVTEILDYTEYGKELKIESENESESLPIEDRFSQLIKLINTFILAAYSAVFVISFISGLISKVYLEQVFLNSLMNSALLIAALSIAFSPDTANLITNLSLYFGLYRMKNKGIQIYRTKTIEKVSSIDVICADKTGTLTQNKMMLTRLYNGINEINVATDTVDGDHKMILRIAALCCDGNVEMVNGISSHSGDATQTAIIAASMEHLGLSKYDLDNIYPRMASVPFDPNYKLMSTLNVIDGKNYLIIRGAVDELIPKCSNNCERFNEWAKTMSLDGLRVVGVAIKQVDETVSELSYNFSENELNFIGLLGLADMPRVDSRKAVIACQKAGINVVMFTGDQKDSAYTFAQKMKIARNEEQVISGYEIDSLTDDELNNCISNYTVFSQVDSAHRVRIVNAFKQLGLSVAVTGDNNVNTDSLRIADVAYSMGAAGSESAICESEIVIKDDSFATVVESIKCCRGIFNNISKTAKYFFSSAIGIITSIVFSCIIFGVSLFTNCEIVLLGCFGSLLTTIALCAENFSKRDINNVIDNSYGVFKLKFIFDILFNAAIYLLAGLVSYSLGLNIGTSPSSFAFCSMIITFIATALVFRRNGGTISFKTDNKVLIYVMLAQVVLLILMNVLGLGKFNAISAISWIWLILLNAGITLIAIAIKKIRK